ncbi:MAG TPA: PIN domain-containing protein [Acidimicrobiales bacterium]|nr:PIN domain-containing protein [Acidimicrobiales bacterium]
MSSRPVVLDAAALLDLLVARDLGFLLESRVAGAQLHVCAHVDSDVWSSLRRLERAGVVGSSACERYLASLAAAPIERHPASHVFERAWRRRHAGWLVDVLSFELAISLGASLITTDPRMADAAGEIVEFVRFGSDQK